jgi:hypothetical protein
MHFVCLCVCMRGHERLLCVCMCVKCIFFFHFKGWGHVAVSMLSRIDCLEILATIQSNTIDYVGLDMYREWKKIEFPKEYYI